MKRIFTATGQEEINKAISFYDNYAVVGIGNNRDSLLEQIERVGDLEILIVGDALRGETDKTLTEILLKIKKKFENLRIIYLTNFDRHNELKILSYGKLIDLEIYDIVYGNIDFYTLKDSIDIPKDKNDKNIKQIKEIIKNLNKSISVEAINFEIPDEVEKEEILDGSYQNMAVVSSIKPGTGKSFISSNIASAIARYGKKKNGKLPTVGLIDADMQNLSIGTLLQIEDNKNNLKTALTKIDSIMTRDGDLIDDLNLVEEVNMKILECFVEFGSQKNLRALTGSQLSFNDVSGFSGNHFSYLFDLAANIFDILIVDTNSSLAHSSTLAALSKAKTCFYVMNLDFNNIRNNLRYKKILEEIKIAYKVKYILNEDVSNIKDNPEKLKFTVEELTEFDFSGKVPLIPKTVFLNRLFDGIPIVYDEVGYTQDVKNELLKIANNVYEINGFKSLEDDNGKNNRGKIFGVF